MAGDTRLADLCEAIVDCPHSTPVWTDSGVVVLRNQNIRNGRLDLSEPSYTDEAHFLDRTRRALPMRGDIVITREAPMGEVCMIPPGLRCCLGQRMVLLRPNRKRIEPRYLLYALQFKAVQHEIGASEGTGSTVSNLRIPLLQSLPIPTWPLADQRAIAHILGTLDDKIELNRRMNETLEAMARALFKSWFIDFDPVRRNTARSRNQPSPPSPLPVGEGRPKAGVRVRSMAGEGRNGLHYRGGHDFAGLLERARELRKAQTPAEHVFWELVRDRRMLRLKFRRQHQLGDYIADFYCHEHRLVVELDGGIHSVKRKKDHKRDAWMQAQGFTVLRFSNQQLLDDPASVLAAIADVAEGSPKLPSPPERRVGDEAVVSGRENPLPLGEGLGEGSVCEIDRLFPDFFVDSELGEIPKGWVVQPFAAIVDIIGGGTPKTSVPEYRDGDTPWFSVVDAPGGADVWVVDTAKRITREGVENSSTQILPVGTTIISARGTVGRIALVGVPMAMNQSCYGLRGKQDRRGFFTYFATRDLVASFQQHAHGSVFDTITRDTLAGVSVAVPSAELIEAFETRVGPSMERIRAGLFESRTLAALRDVLLPRLISGTLRVRDAERFIGRAL